MNEEEDGDPPDFYWWSRLVYGLMTNLHCGEREILAMRWDRATAYLDEILIDLDKPADRPLPEFREELEAVRKAMRREREESRNNRGKQ